jgi:hypothetical protein
MKRILLLSVLLLTSCIKDGLTCKQHKSLYKTYSKPAYFDKTKMEYHKDIYENKMPCIKHHGMID